MTYKEFLIWRLEKAKQNEYFDEDGNSVVATSNRGFFRSIWLDIKAFNSDIYHSVDWKEFLCQCGGVLGIITLPITYIPFLLLRHYISNKQAHKEMKEEYLEELLKRKES